MIVIIMGILSRYIQTWREGYLNYSVADCFIAMQGTWEFGTLILPLTMLFFLYLFKSENRINYILRQKGRKELWNKWMFKTVLFSLLVTISLQSCIFLLGGLASDSYINWSQIETVYYYHTEKYTNDISFYVVVIISSIMMFLKVLAMSLLIVLSKWITKRSEIGIVLALFISGIEYFLRNVPIKIFNKILDVSYNNWNHLEYFIIGAVYGIVISIILCFIGLRYAKRKDFLDGEH